MPVLKDFQDMFVPLKEPSEKKPQEALSQLEATVKNARACVNTTQFQEYKKKYEKEERDLLTVMINFTQTFILNENANPAMYGMRMAMYIQKLYDLRRLLKTIETDSERKI